MTNGKVLKPRGRRLRSQSGPHRTDHIPPFRLPLPGASSLLARTLPLHRGAHLNHFSRVSGGLGWIFCCQQACSFQLAGWLPP
jgi:hypothetical protein